MNPEKDNKEKETASFAHNLKVIYIKYVDNSVAKPIVFEGAVIEAQGNLKILDIQIDKGLFTPYVEINRGDIAEYYVKPLMFNSDREINPLEQGLKTDNEIIEFLAQEIEGCNSYADKLENGIVPKATSTPNELRERAIKFSKLMDAFEAKEKEVENNENT